MGLDMYLKKTTRVPGFTVWDYEVVDEAVTEATLKEISDLEELTHLKGANLLLSNIRKYEFIDWYTIYEEAGYWRKANQIHAWFVEEVQNGVDNCDIYEVSQTDLSVLLDLVDGVLSERYEPEEVLPTQQGFFFGTTEYDEWYFQNLKETKSILENILATTNFEKEIIFYQSSW